MRSTISRRFSAAVVAGSRGDLDPHVARHRPGNGRATAEVALDQVDHQRRVGVAHDDHGHIARHVPARVVVDEVVAPDRLDGLLRPDGQAAAERRLGRQPLVHLVLDALASARPGALLLEDDLALAVDLGRGEAEPSGNVGHEHHRLVKRVLASPRHRELVRRLIEAREGILIAPEREAEGLKERHHRARREIGRSVERHVLEVVREAARRVGLVERARGDVEPDAHAAFGILVRANDIAEPIGERARHERGIGRQPVFCRRRRDLGTHHHRQHQQDQDSPHRASSKFNAPPWK
jgi:hypothetical protein